MELHFLTIPEFRFNSLHTTQKMPPKSNQLTTKIHDHKFPKHSPERAARCQPRLKLRVAKRKPGYKQVFVKVHGRSPSHPNNDCYVSDPAKGDIQTPDSSPQFPSLQILKITNNSGSFRAETPRFALKITPKMNDPKQRKTPIGEPFDTKKRITRFRAQVKGIRAKKVLPTADW